MEKQNKQRLEQLVRQGIVPSRKLPMLMQAMTSLQMGKQLTPTERDILAKYMHNMTDIMLKDTTVFNRAKLHTQRTKYQTEDTTVDSLDERNIDGVKVVDGPEDEERMRHAAQTKAKRLSIKKRDKFRLLSPEVKKEKMKAGVEEEVKNMHEHYKNMFEAALEVYGVSNVRDIPANKRKEFFAAVDEAAKIDPVGKADADIDNDGDVDDSDDYLKNRRKAINKAMKKEEFTLEEGELVVYEEMTTGYRPDMGHAGTQGTIKLGGKEHSARKVPMQHYDEFKKKHPGSKVMFRGPRDGKAMHTQKSNAKHFYIVHKKGGVKEEVEIEEEYTNSDFLKVSKRVKVKSTGATGEVVGRYRHDNGDIHFTVRHDGGNTSKHPGSNLKVHKEEVETEAEQLDEYGNPVAKPSMVDKVKMVAKKKAKTGLTMEDAASDAKRDIAADDGRGMAPLKKDEPKPAEPKKQKGRSADHAKHEHIVQQMHKAITVGKPVTFKDGSSHTVDKVHAYKFLHKTMQMKPADRLKAHTDAHASHDNFKKHV